MKKSELLKKMSECGERIEAIDEALKIVNNTGFKPSVLNMHVKSSDSSNSNNHQELNVQLDYEETKKVLELLRDLELTNWIRLEKSYEKLGNGWFALMEWEGKTIYDLLNFAKEEAIKINVMRKEMEQELERIKLIGKEPKVDSKEVMKSVYIARDRDSELYMYLSKPIRLGSRWATKDGEHFVLENVDINLPFVTWESEPLEYRIINDVDIIHQIGNYFIPDLQRLMKKYGVKSIKPNSSNSYIKQDEMVGFNINTVDE